MIKIKFIPVEVEDDSVRAFCKVQFPNKYSKRKFLLRSQHQPSDWDIKISNWVTAPKSLEAETYIETKKWGAKDFFNKFSEFVKGNYSPKLSFRKQIYCLITKPLGGGKFANSYD